MEVRTLKKTKLLKVCDRRQYKENEWCWIVQEWRQHVRGIGILKRRDIRTYPKTEGRS